MQKITSLIFDIDGTLWDVTDTVAKSWNQSAAEYDPAYAKKHIITGALLHREFGKLLSEIGHDLFPDLPEADCLALTDRCCLTENANLRTERPQPYEGVREMIPALSRKMPLFIVSNCQAGYIEAFLEATGLSPFITDHLCPGDSGEAKAANIRTIIRKHRLTGSAYVGDTEGDFLATSEAGIPFIYASYGFGSVPHPDYTISKPLDLINLLKDGN